MVCLKPLWAWDWSTLPQKTVLHFFPRKGKYILRPWLPSPVAAHGGAMASSPIPEPSKTDTHDSFYCSDPNCPYCADLRSAQTQWKRQQEQKDDAAS